MTSQARKVQQRVMLAGVEVPCLDWSVTVASNGSLGTLDATTSIAMIGATGIDINALAETPSGAQLDVYAGYDDGTEQHIFGGVLDRVQLKLRADMLILKGRDWGSLLVDRKDVISGLNYRNQTVDKIASQIATLVGLTSNVVPSSVMAGNEFAGDHVLQTNPQPLWSVLQMLAEQCGYEVKVTPDKVLYFGPPDTGGSVTVTWGALPKQEADNPLLDLDITHSPRRNKFFEVRVISYHPRTGNLISAKAKNNSAKSGGRVRNQHAVIGSSSGKTGMGIFKGRSGTGGTGTQAVITVFKDGLTQQQAVAKATAIAKDIAKREILVEGCIEGLPSIKTHQLLQVMAPNGSLGGYEHREYFVTSITHKFSVPTSPDDGGYTTDFKALSDPSGVSAESQ